MKKKIEITNRRKQRKETFRHNVLAQAYDIIIYQGLDALSMRAISNLIGCSQSKIYEVFNDKNHLCETLCGELSSALLNKLKSIRMTKKHSENYLKKLFIETLIFHEEHPHSDSLFTLICYGEAQSRMPTPFQEIEDLFIVAINKLGSPLLNTAEKVLLALNAIRFLFIGASQISIFDKQRSKEIAKSALDDLIRGWTS